MNVNSTAEIAEQPLHSDDERTPMITPDQARQRMLTPRQRAARAIAIEIDSFVEDGNDSSVIVMPFDDDIEENAAIAELLDYRDAGWQVESTSGTR